MSAASTCRTELKLRSIMNDRHMPSPPYSHISPVAPNALSSTYNLTQTVIGPASSGHYQVAYPTLSGSHLQPVPLQVSRYNQHPRFPTHYPPHIGTGNFDMYQTPGPGSSKGKLSPAPYSEQHAYAAQYESHQDATPLLTTSTLSRVYDSTIPQYYPVTSEPRWSNQVTPNKVRDELVGQKRKREKHLKNTPPSTTKALKTPKRVKHGEESGSGRAAKRVKVEGDQQQTQLPTPPSTGRESYTINLPHQSQGQSAKEKIAVEEESSDIQQTHRRGVVVTRHQEEGRKIGLMGLTQGDTEETATPDEARTSPRLTLIPALNVSASGLATLSTDEVLESEMAWLTNGGRSSGSSSPDMVRLQTPTMLHEAEIATADDSPTTEDDKVTRRLQAFVNDTKLEEPLICTRIDMFGRVAVRKNVAIRFLGLDGSARIVEEMCEDEVDGWVERPVASCSKIMIRPSWPDHEAPWALAGGSRKERRQREESEKAEVLKRYFESASEDSSKVESFGSNQPLREKGKSIMRLIRSSSSDDTSDPRRRLGNDWEASTSDAKEALLTSLRGRSLPSPRPGKVACACGAQSTTGMGSMISCSSCKTWHHLVCCGIEEETQLGPHWWCSRCQAEAIAMSTPAHTTVQSDERSSAFKGELTTIALAPSPMFVSGATFSQAAASARTPKNRTIGSPSSRNHRSRILSYGTDMWAYTEDGFPSTPIPTRPDRYSTPRTEEAPFDVTSTPSRHLDFNFSQPSLFSLTPLGGRSRMPTTMLIDRTPFRAHNQGIGADHLVPSRHEFFKELNKGGDPASPQTRWPHALLGAHNVSPSPFGHRTSFSGNKMSSMRSSSRSGLGLGMSIEKEE